VTSTKFGREQSPAGSLGELPDAMSEERYNHEYFESGKDPFGAMRTLLC